MIKWIGDSAVLIYHAVNDEGSQGDTYTIDLTNRKFLLDEEELEWTSDVTDYVRDSKEDCQRYLNEKIQNNRNVIRSTEKEGNVKEFEKAQRHLDRNLRLLAFIEAYEVA